VAGGLSHDKVSIDSTEWYDSKINQWHSGPKMITPSYGGCLAVVKDNAVLYLGGNIYKVALQSVDELDLSSESPHWRQMTNYQLTYNMLVKRRQFGVGVINNYTYAVSYIKI